MLLREYAIKQWFVIPPLLTNVYALPGNCVFSVILHTVSQTLDNETARREI